MKKYYQFRVFALIFLSLKIFANDTEILEISMGNTKSLETKILDFDFDLKPKNIIFSDTKILDLRVYKKI